MTSILEALREIEAERRRTGTPPSVDVPDAAAEPPPAGTLYPLVAGLSVGVILVAIGVWWLGARPPLALENPAAAPAETPVETPVAVEAAAPPRENRIDWLQHAEAPQARVGVRTPARDAPADRGAAPSRAAAAARPPRSAAAVRVVSIGWAASPTDRTATLRLDGRRVTLRQGDRAGGLEVQLILENGVYLARGAEVVFSSLER